MYWDKYFKYDPSSKTGLVWNYYKFTGSHGKTMSIWPGKVAGWITVTGYGEVKLDGKCYKVHRIIYELFNSEIPKGLEIDHKNGNRLDNRPENLRIATSFLSARNRKIHWDNSTGVTGVCLYPKTPDGTGRQYFMARWTNLCGTEEAKAFNINTYGYENAFKLACEYRKQQICLLNEQGAGYTARHGRELDVCENT